MYAIIQRFYQRPFEVHPELENVFNVVPDRSWRLGPVLERMCEAVPVVRQAVASWRRAGLVLHPLRAESFQSLLLWRP
ncbi:hypothetical protein BZM27_36780 [Paraburkholderia steynii]|uniref:Uncharacterized protein n=1 Tax=Paraburkholderia steynii TaxID=1245441 RepID=A0A4R0XDS3_9BURK|nr:hypothetical protein BZM27_36780 [Paraburkholderia steynii]